MKPGRRALGVAESYRGTEGQTSTLAGVVVRADRVVDDFVFGTCTVGGSDATDAVVDLWERLDRPDVRYLFVAGVAPAWYNLLDLHRLNETIERPVLAVAFEGSSGLADALAAEFDGEELDARLDLYGSLPPRRRIETGDGKNERVVFVRAVGLDDDDADRVVNRYTDGNERRPEPLRVAKRLARAADAFRRTNAFRRG